MHMALPGDGPGQIIPGYKEDPFVTLLGLEDEYESISFRLLTAIYHETACVAQ